MCLLLRVMIQQRSIWRAAEADTRHGGVSIHKCVVKQHRVISAAAGECAQARGVPDSTNRCSSSIGLATGWFLCYSCCCVLPPHSVHGIPAPACSVRCTLPLCTWYEQPSVFANQHLLRTALRVALRYCSWGGSRLTCVQGQNKIWRVR